jgi:hypothetical protein
MKILNKLTVRGSLFRDSSAVRLAGAVGHQSTLHKENSGFANPTLGRHISTFRGYQILFSIRNPYTFTGLSTLSKVGGYFEKVGGEWRAKRG